MPIIALTVTWKQLGFYVILYLAALQNIPHELYEAAEVDGAGAVRQVHCDHRAGRAPGDDPGGHPGHHRRGQPVHRAVPADRWWRPERGLDVARAAHVPAKGSSRATPATPPRSGSSSLIVVLIVSAINRFVLEKD